MAKLETLTLRARDPEAQCRFYCDVLGMSDQGHGRVGYAGREVALRFEKAETPYDPRPTDLYWKIALSVPNIELAWGQLGARGLTPSAPRQFRDVGYLAKVTDPEGFSIELIDHWFQGERPDDPNDDTRLGGGAHLSLVTLRTGDIGAVEPDLLGIGMTPLSMQPVEPYGFTLYFYAFTEEAPPDPDLTAVINRPWVYQRPYSVLEIQHVHALDTETRSFDGAGGYASLSISSSKEMIDLPRLKIASEG